MKHFFVTISASEGEGRALVRVGPFGSRWAVEEWVNGFGKHARGLCWEAGEIEEMEVLAVLSHREVSEELCVQLSAEPVRE